MYSIVQTMRVLQSLYLFIFIYALRRSYLATRYQIKHNQGRVSSLRENLVKTIVWNCRRYCWLL